MRRFCSTVAEVQYSVLLYGDCAYAIAAARQYMTIQAQIDRATDCDCTGNSDVLTEIVAFAVRQRQSSVAQIACGQFYPFSHFAVIVGAVGAVRHAAVMVDVSFGGS